MTLLRLLFKEIVREGLRTHPEVVHDFDRLLKLYRNIHGDVVVETRTHGEFLWEGRPVVFPTWKTVKTYRNIVENSMPNQADGNRCNLHPIGCSSACR